MPSPLGDDVVSSVIRDSKASLVTGPDAVRGHLPVSTDPAMWDDGLSSILCLPLRAGGKTLGALILGSITRDAYGTEELEVAADVAVHIGLALLHWQLNHRLQGTAEELGYLSTFPELNPAAIIELDSIGLVYYTNPAADQLFPEWRNLPFRSPLLADLPPCGGDAGGWQADTGSGD